MMKQIVFGLLAISGIGQSAGAALKPSEIGIIAVRSSAQSRELAEYYAKARGIPQTQIFLIDVAPHRNLSRTDWDRKVRPAIRRWIADKKLERTLRCLVTVWDVPLKIGRVDAKLSEVQSRRGYLEAEHRLRVLRLAKRIRELDGLLAGKQPRQGTAITPDMKTSQIVGELNSALTAARQRVSKSANPPIRTRTQVKLGRILAAVGGVSAMIRNLTAHNDSSATTAQRLETLKGQYIGLGAGRRAIQNLPASVSRDQQILSLLEQSNGLVGTLLWIDSRQALNKKNETYASFDSELSLLYWPSYPLLRWQANVLNYHFDGTYTRRLRTTLMVSRLEAPTFELSRKLIDTAIQVEKQGLRGKIYLDARGIRAKPNRPPTRGSYAEYDEALRHLATFLKTQGQTNVVLDNQKALFQPGDCPDAALYCGWYSLAHYIDAFTWKPGSVAYHIASAEATTLRNPKSQVWCKRMLEQGVCATLGPVHEPYLAAFPRPDEFFPLLMSGRYTLVETYYRTKPFNSWVMVLIGDPLYTPFRKHPLFGDKPLPASVKPLIEGKPDFTW